MMLPSLAAMPPEQREAWSHWLTQDTIADLVDEDLVRFSDLNEDGTEE